MLYLHGTDVLHGHGAFSALATEYDARTLLRPRAHLATCVSAGSGGTRIAVPGAPKEQEKPGAQGSPESVGYDVQHREVSC